MLNKEIRLTFEDFSICIDKNIDNSITAIRLDEFILDKEESTPENDVFKVHNTVEIYAEDEEIQEIIKALQQTLSTDD